MGIWTADDDNKLKNLYADPDLSCTRIAGYFPGKSRNSIIGRVHRLKLPLRGRPRPRRVEPLFRPWEEAGVSRRTFYRDKAGPRAAKPPKPTVERKARVPKPSRETTELRCAAIEPHHVALADISGCRWPYGDGPFTFCNHEIFQGSYCGGHFFLSIGAGTGSERAAHKVAKSKLQGAW